MLRYHLHYIGCNLSSLQSQDLSQMVWASSTHPHTNPTGTWTPSWHQHRAPTGRPANEIVLPRPPPRILSHRIHGTGIFTYMNTWMVDFCGVHVGKYTIHVSYGLFVDPPNKGGWEIPSRFTWGFWHASKVDMTPHTQPWNIQFRWKMMHFLLEKWPFGLFSGDGGLALGSAFEVHLSPK